MKVRKGNNNPIHPSLVVGLSKEIREDSAIKLGDSVLWVRVGPKKWELQKL